MTDPTEPTESSPPPEPPVRRAEPRGCNPLVFGVIMATLQMGVLLYFMDRC